MSRFKYSATVLLAGLALVLCLPACSGPYAGYKPSGLPSLIAFSSDRDQTVHVYTAKPDGTSVVSTSTDNQTLDGLPTWTPDGTRILFTSAKSGDFEVWSMNADGSDGKQLTNIKGWDGLAKMSPDGKNIVFIDQQPIPDSTHTNTYILLMNADGSGVVQLTGTEDMAGQSENATRKQGPWNSVPTWSPDSSKILFATTREGNRAMPVLYTMNTDGSNQLRLGLLYPIEGTEPDWSPANNKIVFVRGSAAKGEIWVMDAGFPLPGLTAKKLTDNTDNNHSPVWSPDGKQIAFVSDKFGKEDIFVMNADGTNVSRVTYEDASDVHPSWR